MVSISEATFWLLLLSLCFFVIPIRISNEVDDFGGQFHEFLKAYKKNYSENDEEYRRRFEIFKYHAELAELPNFDRNVLFGITKFSDLTAKEFADRYLAIRSSNYTKNSILKENYDETLDNSVPQSVQGLKIFAKLKGLPSQINWKDKGVLTSIRSQGVCGSCYAHSVISTIESMIAIQNRVTDNSVDNSPPRLSIQQMLECAKDFTAGCKGGDTCDLLEWLLIKKIRILTDEFYPTQQSVGYSSVNGNNVSCRSDEILKKLPAGTKTARVTNFTCTNFMGHEEKILLYLARNGPMTGTVNAHLWQNYVGGVIQYHCNGPVNHAIQLVGYDLLADVPHYIVRNSWGKDFGIDGYLKIAIGENVCNIVSEISIVSVEWS